MPTGSIAQRIRDVLRRVVEHAPGEGSSPAGVVADAARSRGPQWVDGEYFHTFDPDWYARLKSDDPVELIRHSLTGTPTTAASSERLPDPCNPDGIIRRMVRWDRLTPDGVASLTENPHLRTALGEIAGSKALKHGSSLRDTRAIDIAVRALRAELEAASPTGAETVSSRLVSLAAKPTHELDDAMRRELVALDMVTSREGTATFPAYVLDGIESQRDPVFILAQRALRDRHGIVQPAGTDDAALRASRELLEAVHHGAGSMPYAADSWAPLAIADDLDQIVTWVDPSLHPFASATRDRLTGALAAGRAARAATGDLNGLYAPIVDAAAAVLPDATATPAIARVRALESLALLTRFGGEIAPNSPINHVTLDLHGALKVYGEGVGAVPDDVIAAFTAKPANAELIAERVSAGLADGRIRVPTVAPDEAGLDEIGRARAVLANHLVASTVGAERPAHADLVRSLRLLSDNGAADAERSADLVTYGLVSSALDMEPEAARHIQQAFSGSSALRREGLERIVGHVGILEDLPADDAARTTWVTDAIARRRTTREPDPRLTAVLALRPDLVPQNLRAEAQLMYANDLLRTIDIDGVSSAAAPRNSLKAAQHALELLAGATGPRERVAAQARELVERNLDRIDGRSRGPVAGYSNYADHAEVGRVRSDLELLERTAAVDAATPNATAAAAGDGAEQLAW
ncbi:MAG: hypothetical protein JWL76_1063 [Thermoleophilia bacterium]|nr:hypothetical protein [Thermoleophilia bacterium]